MKLKTIIVGLFALFFTADSILRTIRSNFNLGILLVYIITGMLWIYAFFNKQIDLFTKSGFGFIMKIVFFIGCGIAICTAIFLGIKGNINNTKNNEKAVIVLGAGLRGDKVYGVLERRLCVAIEYHKQNPNALIVVTGGRGPQESVAEAVAMKKYLIEHNIDESLIIEEDKSTSTQENFAFALKLLQPYGISGSDAVCYITNDFHVYRSGKYAELEGFTNAVGIGASTGATALLSCYLREICAVFYMWVFK